MKRSSPNYSSGQYPTSEVEGHQNNPQPSHSLPALQLIFLCRSCCMNLKSAIFFGLRLSFEEHQQEVHCFCCGQTRQHGLFVSTSNYPELHKTDQRQIQESLMDTVCRARDLYLQLERLFQHERSKSSS